MRQSKVSVVIPTFHEGKYIRKTLSCLSEVKDIEIIVVDSGSKDGTVKVARRFTDKVFVIRERGISKAKNYGAMQAKGDMLVFIDADVIVPFNFLEKVKSVFKEYVVGATCHILPIKPRLREQIFLVTHNIVVKLLLRCPVSLLKHSRGEFIAVEKKAFMAVGGFNEELPCFEDHDLTWKLSQIGKFVFINDLTVYESMRRIRTWGLLKTIRIWALNFITYVIRRKAYSHIWTPIR